MLRYACNTGMAEFEHPVRAREGGGWGGHQPPRSSVATTSPRVHVRADADGKAVSRTGSSQALQEALTTGAVVAHVKFTTWWGPVPSPVTCAHWRMLCFGGD